MRRLEEIEAEIASLPPDDFRRIALWVREHEETLWDQQFDHDSTSGALDFLFEESVQESAAGVLKDWPPLK